MLQSLYSLAATGSFCWFLASSLWIYPHSLSYFNETIGGPLNGAEHLLGSNLDWGQDLRYLRWWIGFDNQDSQRMKLSVAGSANYALSDLGFYNANLIPEDEISPFLKNWVKSAVKLKKGVFLRLALSPTAIVLLQNREYDWIDMSWQQGYRSQNKSTLEIEKVPLQRAIVTHSIQVFSTQE